VERITAAASFIVPIRFDKPPSHVNIRAAFAAAFELRRFARAVPDFDHSTRGTISTPLRIRGSHRIEMMMPGATPCDRPRDKRVYVIAVML